MRGPSCPGAWTELPRCVDRLGRGVNTSPSVRGCPASGNTNLMATVPIALRPCMESDVEILETTRNDPISAAFSRRGALSRETITKDYILNPKKHTYMITAGIESLGYAVLEEESSHSDFLEISIAILPNARGRGVAGRALEVTREQAQTQFPTKRGIHAWIHDSNEVSRRLFTRKGYVVSGETDVIAGQRLSQYELKW